MLIALSPDVASTAWRRMWRRRRTGAIQESSIYWHLKLGTGPSQDEPRHPCTARCSWWTRARGQCQVCTVVHALFLLPDILLWGSIFTDIICLFLTYWLAENVITKIMFCSFSYDAAYRCYFDIVVAGFRILELLSMNKTSITNRISWSLKGAWTFEIVHYG